MFKLRLIAAAACLLLLGCDRDRREAPQEQFLMGSTPIGVQTVASHLDVPWQLVWGPDDYIWFTEQSGSVSRLDPETGEITRLLTIEHVLRDRTSGLLGMAVHPDL